ncbi:histidine kinase dimerization/phospho-acceptor domain-containing protein [Erythrobacter litoralis]|uniref:histidine kinase n=1 Tax=Erythrobacter litoralis (strain HTCC2594) TaxID=314225 RepID=Q2NC83_ERYLH|nr:histidine kinase dimerization/phospho-acceptor domain-containing protein [Erythrobacter litoralis]ABC62708.1 two-component signal transduction histidine kinase [Erythrobacter litoralis HTCC2594]
MHFDDRLATVLRHRASGERAARTQFRQLLDLLGRARHGRDEKLLAAAWLRLGALGETIPAADRARMIAEPSWRFENAELAAHFAEDEPAVAAAALQRAQLDEDDWEALIPRLPVRARGFLRLRRDLPARAERILDRLGIRDRALPLPQQSEPLVLSNEDAVDEDELTEDFPEVKEPATPVPANDAGPDQDADRPESVQRADEPTPIAALVERIEAFQKNRNEAKARLEEASPSQLDPPLPFVELQDAERAPLEDSVTFTTDGEGRIDWADNDVSAMLRYLKLPDVLCDADRIAMRRHALLSTVPISLDGAPAIAGEWYLDAAPRFDPIGGRFTGYAGRLRRAEPNQPDPEAEESDRIRQLLHELRTPVNAIQGFAEVIQQQLFGPTPNEYRALAATIAGDAARILAGFDELDRLAKLEAGAREIEVGDADLSTIVAGQIAQLGEILATRNAGLKPAIATGCRIAIDTAEAEAMSWRLLAALAASLAPGEEAQVALTQRDDQLTLDCHLPKALAGKDDIFAAEARKQASAGRLSAGAFGSGFALRLARAEARSAGGSLARVDDRLVLTLPALTVAEAEPSPETGSYGAAQPEAS